MVSLSGCSTVVYFVFLSRQNFNEFFGLSILYSGCLFNEVLHICCLTNWNKAGALVNLNILKQIIINWEQF